MSYEQSARNRFVGAAEHGRVRMELDNTGDLVSVTIDPRARRLDSDQLAAAVLTAFQAARTELRERLRAEPESLPLAPTDPDERDTEVANALAEAERSLGTLTDLAAEFNSKLARLV